MHNVPPVMHPNKNVLHAKSVVYPSPESTHYLILHIPLENIQPFVSVVRAVVHISYDEYDAQVDTVIHWVPLYVHVDDTY